MSEFTINDTSARFEVMEQRIAELERTQAEQAGLLHQQVLLTNRVMDTLQTLADWKDVIEKIGQMVDLNTQLGQEHAGTITKLVEFAEHTGKTLASHRTQLDRLSSVQPFHARGTVN